MSHMGKTFCILTLSQLVVATKLFPLCPFFSPRDFPTLGFVIPPLMETSVSSDLTVFSTTLSET